MTRAAPQLSLLGPKARVRRTRGPMEPLEGPLMRAIEQACNALGWCCVHRNTVGYDKERHVTFGLGRGSPDLVGLVRLSSFFTDGREGYLPARAFALEVKSSTGRVEPHQATWHAGFRKLGGYVAVVRSVEEAMNAASRAAQGWEQ